MLNAEPLYCACILKPLNPQLHVSGSVTFLHCRSSLAALVYISNLKESDVASNPTPHISSLFPVRDEDNEPVISVEQDIEEGKKNPECLYTKEIPIPASYIVYMFTMKQKTKVFSANCPDENVK
ncbi:hypothetical protein HBH92_062050 [Parastagonospora nodorum]|nr:hypothetical protein HBH92_062050 [Parastagonospora nodorum]KAH4424316.1 hypothetical protein HBH93_186850 [Parastagonospora nodorum]KAH4549046.1 hypothetical protein HBH85_055390 [Parastagonospora nodorum]KAH4560904.1 hypothetical protein HBH86_069730 [Parastagonospora nodorum]KAH4878287.1 hypothetical protein HBH59_073890 [Parastagonospora nodorum]